MKKNWLMISLGPYAQSLIQQSVSRQVQSLFQSQLSTQCDLELPPSDDSILSFPEASYIFFLVFLSLLSLLLSFLQ
jgi:hypothetical protein